MMSFCHSWHYKFHKGISSWSGIQESAILSGEGDICSEINLRNACGLIFGPGINIPLSFFYTKTFCFMNINSACLVVSVLA
jgi:hypothetical protein